VNDVVRFVGVNDVMRFEKYLLGVKRRGVVKQAW
jgi:hypothetical protein